VNKLPLVSGLLSGQKVIPVVAVEDNQQALGLGQALLEGGVSVIEVTLRNHFAIDAIELIKQQYPQMLVLAGTVNSSDAMHDVIAAGADGVISPGLTPSLLDTAHDKGVAFLPGVATASEMLLAIEYGLSECKLFPASVVGGVDALKAFHGPFPDLRFCPTGGINSANYQDYLGLPNVICVGGSWIAPTSMIVAHNWAEITQLCKAVV